MVRMQKQTYEDMEICMRNIGSIQSRLSFFFFSFLFQTNHHFFK